MRSIWAVYKRELALFFRSPIAYIVATSVLLFVGLLFTAITISEVQAALQAAQQGAPGGGATATQLLNATSLITFLMFLIAPLLTMSLIAQENREGTLEVLMTLPMNESAFIIGKFLAAWTYFTILLLVTLVQVWLASWMGVPDYGVVFSSYLGAWLYGGAALAICLIWSAVTEEQVVAAFLGSVTILVLYLSDAFAIYFESLSPAGLETGASNAFTLLAAFFREISLNTHFQASFASGILQAEDALYYGALIVAALFITTRIVEIRRWRD